MPGTVPPASVGPKEALERLREGNKRFVSGEGSSFRRWHPNLVDGQWPFAVVLGCADSRAPAEFVFDQGLGDLFVIRVAGNIVAPSLAGSVEFAASQFQTRLVVVMGHTQCGAVGAAVSAVERGSEPESRIQQSIVDRIRPHIEQVCHQPGEHEAHVTAAVSANALASARQLERASPLLIDLVKRGQVVIVASVYDLATGVVTFLEP